MNAVLSAIRAHPLPMLNLADRSVFVGNLLFMHAVMIASEPLIEEVLKRPMNAALREFYDAHLEEECGHAEWLADDLESIGAQPRLDWRAAQVAGPQYYLVRHGPPQALLGYMAALECRPMRLADVDALERLHGTLAVRTLRHHAENDLEHGPALLRIIERAGETEAVAHNAGLTSAMLAWALAGSAEPGDSRSTERSSASPLSQSRTQGDHSTVRASTNDARRDPRLYSQPEVRQQVGNA